MVAAVSGAALAANDPATSCRIPGFREKAQALMREARTHARWCGRQQLPAAAALTWSDALAAAAAAHSRDMASRDYFDHASPQGERVGARATAQGYEWRLVGENIAGGDRSLDRVMAGWLRSEGHCRNIMNSQFADFGLACVESGSGAWGTYWTMVLGRRR